jgi:threonylcarbamoyladenosine tRNA methylthiotransferase MtaB
VRVYVRTFGCRANQYDSEQVKALLVSGGHDVADSLDDADAAVFNSCAVTADAEADLRQSVRRAARERPALRSVVMGCAAARDDGRLRALPSVETVVAGGDVQAVGAALGIHVPLRRAAHQDGTRAVLRVQDGCDEHCTFCATTLARGPNRSRSVEELCEEARALAEHHAEIVITGIHIGSYGQDIGSSLGVLMQKLIDRVPAVRFRLSSVEATELDDALLDLFRGDPLRLAPYLHAPLQSGSDRVLRRMGRSWYSARTYGDAIERLTAGRSIFGLGADVIVGFPGETDADHAETMAVIDALPFTSLHVFPFSERPGTPAAKLGNRVHPETVRARSRELRALAARKAKAYEGTRIGGLADVIVQGGAGTRQGLTGDYLSVSVARHLPRGTRFEGRLLHLGGALHAEADPAAPAVAPLTQHAARSTQPPDAPRTTHELP